MIDTTTPEFESVADTTTPTNENVEIIVDVTNEGVSGVASITVNGIALNNNNYIANENGKFISIDLADGDEQTEMIKKIAAEFPDLKIAKNQIDYAKIQENAHTFIIENNGNETALAEKIELAIKNIQK